MNKIILSTRNQEYKVFDIDNVLFFRGDGGYTIIHLCNNEKHITSRSLKAIENEINSESFIRIKQNVLVNISHIIKLKCSQPYTVTMKDGSELHVSRRKKKIFKEKLKNSFIYI